MRNGETITIESPLISKDTMGCNSKEGNILATAFVLMDIRDAIEKSGLKFRPYALRVYWASAMDVAEGKGIASHNWREFWVGHVGDILARYSTNKKLAQEMIEEIRETYRKCSTYLETGRKPLTEVEKEELNRGAKKWYLSAIGFTDEEIGE